MKTFSFTGWPNSGKTTLIIQLIKKFKQKNKKVIAIKHAPHKYHLEPDAKDSTKFLDAGCDEVYLVSKSEILNMKKINQKNQIFDIIDSKLGEVDILLLEGLYRNDIPVIEVFNSRENDQLKFSMDKLTAIVSEEPITRDIPVFKHQDIDKIVKFMEEYNG